MNLRTRRWSLVAGVTLAISMVGAPVIAASPSPDDPVATVEALLDAIATKDFADLGLLVCEQYRGQVESRFVIDASAFAGLPETVDVQALIDGLVFTIDPRSVTPITNDGTYAQVDVQATLTVSVEETVAREFVHQLIESQGQEPNETLIDAVMPEVMRQVTRSEDPSTTVDVQLENGAWFICDSLEPDPSPAPSGDPLASPAASPAPAASPVA